MSRVDEALQRARQQQRATAPGSAPAADSPVHLHGTALIDEQYPQESAASSSRRPLVSEPKRQRPTPVPGREVAAGGSLLERVDDGLRAKVVVDQQMLPASREQYRRLAATLHHAHLENGLKVIMVTSAVPGEGKTLTSSNLALTFSESYERDVLLIDADLRRPALHSVFGLAEGSGLCEGLRAERPTKLSARQVSNKLAVLPAGKPTSNPMASLTSDRMRQLVDEARGSFDWVIIDTPPLALLPDAHLLASIVDGALLVVKADSTPYPLVKRAADAIGRERTLGVVLNRAKHSGRALGYGYYDDDYYYGVPEESDRS